MEEIQRYACFFVSAMYFDLGFPFFVSDNKLLESCIARDLCHPASRSLLEHTDKLVQPHGGRR